MIMKSRFAALLLILIFVLVGCTSSQSAEMIASYSKDRAPVHTVKTENMWISLISSYGSSDYSVSVSENAQDIKPVYSTKDADIRFFDACDSFAAWCEKSEELYTYKVLNTETEETVTVKEVETKLGFQPQNVGIYRDCVYFINIDYETRTVNACEYNTVTGETKTVRSFEFVSDALPHTVCVDNGYLTVSCSDFVNVTSLDSGAVVFESALPESTAHVFAASYDSTNNVCALYYADEDSEDIGILESTSNVITSLYTFGQNEYAYHDTVKCRDGHIYWIRQLNVSGNVTDHYSMIDYDYKKNVPVEIKRTFGFYCGDDGIYSLRFNKGGSYSEIELYRHK